MTDATGLASVSVTPPTLAPLKAVIEEQGLATAIDPATLDTDVALADYFRLCDRIAQTVGDEAIHVSLRPLMLGTSNLVRDRLAGTRTVREMLDMLAQSYNIIHGGAYNRVTLARGELIYIVDDSGFPYAMNEDDPFILFSLEALLVYVHVLLQSSAIGDDPLPLHSLRTRRAITGAGASPLIHWGVPIAHGAPRFELHYDRTIGSWPVDPDDCPVLGARTIYGGIAKALDECGQTPSEDNFVERVGIALLDGLADQESIARHFGMSTASLRRRLAERGTSFRELRATTYGERAKSRLRYGASVADIAEELGFSDGRSFARAFRGWTGLSPRQYRGKLHHD